MSLNRYQMRLHKMVEDREHDDAKTFAFLLLCVLGMASDIMAKLGHK